MHLMIFRRVMVVTLSLALGAASTQALGRDAPPEISVARCAAERPAPGLSTHLVTGDGATRRYLLYVPRHHMTDRAVPAVIDIHGSGSDPAQELAISRLAIEAEQRGFVVVLPVAVVPFSRGGTTWNVPADPTFADDVRFIARVLDDVASRVCLDRSRVYVTGFSGGARLATEVACRLADRIAALGAVGGLRSPGTCGRAVPVIAFHGTADPVNPYDGAGPDYWRYGIDRALADWVSHNGCDARPAFDAVAPTITRVNYRHCASGSRVVLYRLDGAGHGWPGSAVSLPVERFGPAPRGLDATAEILEFFEQERAPVRD